MSILVQEEVLKNMSIETINSLKDCSDEMDIKDFCKYESLNYYIDDMCNYTIYFEEIDGDYINIDEIIDESYFNKTVYELYCKSSYFDNMNEIFEGCVLQKTDEHLPTLIKSFSYGRDAYRELDKYSTTICKDDTKKYKVTEYYVEENVYDRNLKLVENISIYCSELSTTKF